jgi:RNA polymerase sigma factor (TIGR02999 family)
VVVFINLSITNALGDVPNSSEITQLLHRWSEGDEDAFSTLVPLVYERLKYIAHARLVQERAGNTLDTTGLVHEAYLKLTDVNRMQWQDREHFFSLASRVMRRVLIDHAHHRLALKRGGGVHHVELNEEHLLVADADAERFIALDEALQALEVEHPRQGKAVELHYFGGLTQAQVGQTLGISQPTAMRDLRFARAWIARHWNLDY